MYVSTCCEASRSGWSSVGVFSLTPTTCSSRLTAFMTCPSACLRVDGRIREAVEHLEQACQRRSHLVEGNASRLASQRALAGAYRADGRVKKAVNLLERVVAVSEKTFGEDRPDRLASQH